MATNTGKEVGRVSIRVLPNSTKLRADLKKVLDRIESTMSLNLDVRAKRQQFDRDINSMVHDAEKNSVTLNADADTGRAREQIAVASRSRIVNFTVRVSKSSLASVGTALAAISGARLAGTVLQDIGRGLSNLDKNLPKLAAVGLGVANVTSLLLGSVGGIVTVGAGLISIVGVLGAAPGILAGAAVGAITLAVALKDAKEQLADLGPQWTDLGGIISNNFWDRAKQPILDLNNDLFPSLKSGLDGVSASLGNWAASLAAGLQSAFGGGRLDSMFARLVESIDISSAGTRAFANAIANLGTVGANNLPRLASWFSDLVTRFDTFVGAAAADGRLQGWIDAGVIAAQDLGRALSGITGIFNGVYKAAEASGGQGLSFLADVLQRVSDIVNGPGFQAALTTVFIGAAEGANGLAKALGPVGDLFGSLAPTIARILSMAGGTLGSLFSSLADALSDPVFAVGLQDFFAGIGQGLLAISPTLPTIAALFGTLGTTLGVLAKAFGPVIAALVEGLAPVLGGLLTSVQELAPILAGELVTAFTDLAPTLSTLAVELFPKLVEMIIALLPILPVLVDLIILLAPVITAAAQSSLPLIQAIGDFFNAIKTLADFLNGDASLDDLKQAMIDLPFAILLPKDALLDLVENMVKGFQQAVDAAGRFAEGVRTNLGNAADELRSLPRRALEAVGELGSTLFSSGKSLIGGFIDGIRSMISEVADAAARVVAAAGDYFPHSPARKGEFSGRGWTLYSGRATVDGFIEGMDQRTRRLRAQSASTMAAASFGGSGTSGGSSDVATAGGGLTITGGNFGYDPREIFREQRKQQRIAQMRTGMSKVRPA